MAGHGGGRGRCRRAAARRMHPSRRQPAGQAGVAGRTDHHTAGRGPAQPEGGRRRGEPVRGRRAGTLCRPGAGGRPAVARRPPPARLRRRPLDRRGRRVLHRGDGRGLPGRVRPGGRTGHGAADRRRMPRHHAECHHDAGPHLRVRRAARGGRRPRRQRALVAARDRLELRQPVRRRPQRRDRDHHLRTRARLRRGVAGRGGTGADRRAGQHRRVISPATRRGRCP
ncbi:PE-PGRS family protein [Mycolicibacterium vanbaalenii PYR-1]|uniref:PE-PGRS family protein n=1 Tax=Mycolicibacterium vanbaalenii (strain DSM 7251 / JCM 13017 / BCRC 16820 / KCTC 9966 / NRRL B-24157 / PYR-1) TaxID=350058 RepID=A1TA01_MYCVP|nr:PE-PGRS family protein [Mycolicibacterium vanbaalenii PYR-1]